MKKALIIASALFVTMSCQTETVDDLYVVKAKGRNILSGWDTGADRGLEMFLKDTYDRKTTAEFSATWDLRKKEKRNTTNPDYFLLTINPFKTVTVPTVDGVEMNFDGFYFLYVRATDADRVVSFMASDGELIYEFIRPAQGQVVSY